MAEDIENEDEFEEEETDERELEDAEDADQDEEEEEEEEEESEGHRRGGRPSSDRGPRRSSRSFPRRRFGRRERVCQFCADKTKSIDYKQTDLLRRFVTDQGKIRGRRETGTCAKHQRMVARAVKRARHMALLSYVGESRR
jgi:small subunit ribosomal protein S18